MATTKVLCRVVTTSPLPCKNYKDEYETLHMKYDFVLFLKLSSGVYGSECSQGFLIEKRCTFFWVRQATKEKKCIMSLYL